MIERHLPFDFQGRYYTLGGSGNAKDPPEVWVVLHGQGQLAKYFLEKFRPIAGKDRLIIAPEGLSRYYLDNFDGRVGASWMTRENRLTDISNYLTFLSSVYQKEIHDPESCKITLLGFSQGAATASRWAIADNAKFHRLILWGGLFPPDLDLVEGHNKLKDMEILNIYGDKDEYLNDKRIQEQFQIANKLKVSYSTRVFNGTHEIHPDTLKDLV